MACQYRGWLTFNLTKVLSDWTLDPFSNHGLLIEAKHNNRRLQTHEAGLVTRFGPEEKRPFMVGFFTTPEVLTRKKRAPRQDRSFNNNRANWDAKKVSSNCKRRELHVSFKDLGWEDWIIAPDGYDAFYCYGKCSFPLNNQLNASNHAIVQTLVHLMKPNSVPKPCCVPTNLTSIQVLYYNDNANVIMKLYRNMIVKACGCH